jgi:PII-like signaling protein
MASGIKTQSVTLVRVYTDDSQGHISKTLDRLHDRGDVIGTTIFRGVAGFGKQGHIHQTSLLDLSSHLPLVIEFYHKSDKSEELIQFIHEQISNAHIISWEVNLSFEHLD